MNVGFHQEKYDYDTLFICLISNYCLRLVPPVGRRLELGLVRNMLASLVICPNVMQLMLLLYFIINQLEHVCPQC